MAHLRSLRNAQRLNKHDPPVQQAYLNFLAGVLSSLSFVCDGSMQVTTCLLPPQQSLWRHVHTIRSPYLQEKALLACTQSVSASGWPTMATTMAGHRRIKNVEMLLHKVHANGVKGSFLEAGVWRGGMSLYAAAVMHVHKMHSRKVYLCDSFQGLPAPRVNSVRVDETFYIRKNVNSSLSVGEHAVRANFARYGIPQDNVVTVPGYFVDSLPTLREDLLWDRSKVAVLRLDGDMYDSTVDILYNLYDLVAVSAHTASCSIMH